jgi:hypothetical protein
MGYGWTALEMSLSGIGVTLKNTLNYLDLAGDKGIAF